MAQFPRVPTGNNKQYTLDAQASAGATTLTLNESVSSVVRAPGYCVIDRIDSNGNLTPTSREYKKFTGVSGADLTGVTSSDGTDQVHAVGAIVEFVPDVDYEQDWYDAITTDHSTTGTHTNLISLSSVNAQRLTVATASINTFNTNNIVSASLASLQNIQSSYIMGVSQATLSLLKVVTHFNASGASKTGVFPSGASGGLLTSNGSDAVVFAPPASTTYTWANHTTTYGGFSADPTPSTIRYVQIGNVVFVQLTATGNGTSNATSLTCTLPVAASGAQKIHCVGRAVDNGTIQTSPAMVSLTNGSTTATFYKDQSETAWTGSGNKSINFSFQYEV